MDRERQDWLPLWKEVADYILPHKYIWLMDDKTRKNRSAKNPNIADGTATAALKVLASGMMNGITAPSRPWFKLRLAGFGDDESWDARVWLDEVERRMLLVMATSNFYNSLATVYVDLALFGTAAMLIYEDNISVIRCYNMAAGEYLLGQSARQEINTFSRRIRRTVAQMVEQWGEENCSDSVKMAHKSGGANLTQERVVWHLVKPNSDRVGRYGNYPFIEYYWEEGATKGEVLGMAGFNELPGIFPRWETLANDSYGTSWPAAQALGDIIQLQHESKRKGQSLDFMNRPPLQADIQLADKPNALIPGGITFVQGVNTRKVEPLYTVNPPINEMMLDIRDIQARIREFFHNDLFQMISQLNTVRSATEIDARREEKLILLGPVLERFGVEALDPSIARVFAAMGRVGLIPPAPASISGAQLEIQYVSILAAAQSAVGVIPSERFVQFTGQLAAVYPPALDLPDFDAIIRDYGRDIGTKAKHVRPVAAVEESRRLRAEQLAAQQAANIGQALVGAGKTLSETDVGGGANALQQMMSR
jgi:hypothetical protein